MTRLTHAIYEKADAIYERGLDFEWHTGIPAAFAMSVLAVAISAIAVVVTFA